MRGQFHCELGGASPGHASPTSTLLSAHFKQSSNESLESHAELDVQADARGKGLFTGMPGPRAAPEAWRPQRIVPGAEHTAAAEGRMQARGGYYHRSNHSPAATWQDGTCDTVQGCSTPTVMTVGWTSSNSSSGRHRQQHSQHGGQALPALQQHDASQPCLDQLSPSRPGSGSVVLATLSTSQANDGSAGDLGRWSIDRTSDDKPASRQSSSSAPLSKHSVHDAHPNVQHHGHVLSHPHHAQHTHTHSHNLQQHHPNQHHHTHKHLHHPHHPFAHHHHHHHDSHALHHQLLAPHPVSSMYPVNNRAWAATTYHRTTSHIATPAPSATTPSSAPTQSSGALELAGLAGSSSDDCEEATRRITAAFPHLHAGPGHERSNKTWSVLGSSKGSETGSPRLLRSRQGSADGNSALSLEEAEALERRRQGRGNYHLTGQAAIELFLRLNHARQTLDFVKRQATMFATLDRASMGIREALDMLNQLREYQAALVAGSAQLDPDLPLKEHAFQTAELCRIAHPDQDWLHLVGLIHGLGKLLAHKMFGSQPQWATCGESFPLGCRFDPSLQGQQFFSVNPDRRRRLYNTPLGIYQAGCGLQNVYMSWSAAEYLYLMLLLNDTNLPPEALFIIRYQQFYALTSGSGAYRQLLSRSDEACLPLLASFQQLSCYRRVALPPDKALAPDERKAYYDKLIEKYIGKDRKLAW